MQKHQRSSSSSRSSRSSSRSSSSTSSYTLWRALQQLGGGAARVRRGRRVQQAGRVREALAGAAVPLPRPAGVPRAPLAQRRPHHRRQDPPAQDVRSRQEAAQMPVLPGRHVDPGVRGVPGQRHAAGGALPLPAWLRGVPRQAPGLHRGPGRLAEVQVLLRLQPAKSIAVPAQGALPAVHRAQEAGPPRRRPGRGQHQLAVRLPAQPLLPDAPLGSGRHPGQHVSGRQRAHLQRLLPAAVRRSAPLVRPAPEPHRHRFVTEIGVCTTPSAFEIMLKKDNSMGPASNRRHFLHMFIFF
ncbi:hypothetical protein FOCC_FOCC011326 [Frankliniella occidentalis]|nr:hypothetical protein FOCC_FOCC011326 [Frankliniella occidentalis]